MRMSSVACVHITVELPEVDREYLNCSLKLKPQVELLFLLELKNLSMHHCVNE